MPIIKSMLDNDLYKITMMQAIFYARHLGINFSDVIARYQFKLRTKVPMLPSNFAERVEEEVAMMEELYFDQSELAFLHGRCPFLKPGFLEMLTGYRFDPSEVICEQDGNDLTLTVEGPWWRTVLWEVPLMAIISELYFKMTEQEVDEEWPDVLDDKIKKLKEHNIILADFGTRRRFSFEMHKNVVSILKMKLPTFVGTSNVHLAEAFNLKPIGTHAHEWFMGVAALFGYRLANRIALKAWSSEFSGDLGIALSDTFTSESFFRDFDKYYAKLFDGVRQDSGCPFVFADQAIKHYEKLGIDPKSKTVIFSDGLDADKAIEIQKHCNDRIKCAFGIGTNLTNDFGPTPLNMVIKLSDICYQGRQVDCVKLSDSVGKYSGNPEEVRLCKAMLGLV